MSDTNATMMDLPDEIFLHICSTMTSIDVLYAFIGVNQRFNRLARDRLFTRSIELIETKADETIRPLPDLILNRFSEHILPAIHSLVESLTVESSTVEHTLSVKDYPSLTILTLLNIDEDFAARHFTGKKISIGSDGNMMSYTRWIQETHDSCICSRNRSRPWESLSAILVGMDWWLISPGISLVRSFHSSPA